MDGGKEGINLKTTIRSDTFLKVGVARVYYPSKSGWRISGALGKSLFISTWLSLRLSVGATYLQSFIEVSDVAGARTVADSGTFAFIETGLVAYF